MNFLLKKILIVYILACNLISIPEYSLAEEVYEVEPVSSFFSPELLQGQNYTWVLQEWYQMEDWLRQDTTYEPKSGDIWTMTIIGDLSQVILTITALEFFEIHFDPQSIPKLTDYLQFNISGHTFNEVFGNPDAEEYNWLILSRLFLIPYTIKDVDGNTRNASSFVWATLENIVIDPDIDIGQGDLNLKGSVTGQYYETHIDLECSLGLRDTFNYTKKSVETKLTTRKIILDIEENEFKPNYTDKEDDDYNTVDFPFEISSYPYLIGWSILAVIVIVKKKKKIVSTLSS